MRRLSSSNSGTLRPLTPREDRFVSEYLIDLNGSQAAIRAGYSANTAAAAASRLLRNVNVAAIIQEKRDARAKIAGITAENVLLELAKLGFSNMQDYIGVTQNGDISALTRDQAAAIQEVTASVEGESTRVRLKLYDKRAALVDIGRHLGMFDEHIELTGPNGGPIQVQQITSRVIDADYTDITDAVSESVSESAAVSESVEAPVGPESERGAGADNSPRLPAAVST